MMYYSVAILRAMYLFMLFCPCIFYYYWFLNNQEKFYNCLVWTAEAAGPAWIKLGQWASTRQDLFPQEMCLILSKLQKSCSPHSFAHSRRIIQESIGKDIEEVFEEFDPNPKGIGAIAQVYKAKLNEKVTINVKGM